MERMEISEIEERIRHFTCLLMRAKNDGMLGMVVYYQVMIDELMVNRVMKYSNTSLKRSNAI